MFIRTFARRVFPAAMINYLRYDLFDGHAAKTYSQEGEDMILRRFFGTQKIGFYVDVGAHHPKRFSNTYVFYRQGWRGINIDAMPGSMSAFRRVRPRDINIECGVAKSRGFLTYHVFNEPALNGFNVDLSETRSAENSQYRVIDRLRVPVRPLRDVLREHMPFDQKIDFMNIDVEGLDLEVLESSDWDLYRPRIVLVEVLRKSLVEIQTDPVGEFMHRNGYKVLAKCVNTVLFQGEV